MKKIFIILGIVLLIMGLLYAVFLFGGDYVESYKLNKLSYEYENNMTEGNFLEYEFELLLIAMTKMATTRFVDSQVQMKDYLESHLIFVKQMETERDKFKASMLYIQLVHPYLFYLTDKQETDHLMVDGIDYLNKQYQNLYLKNDLDSRETEGLVCSYVSFVPYAVKNKEISYLKDIFVKLDSINYAQDLNCVFITKQELDDSRIMTAVISGDYKLAKELYLKYYGESVENDWLTEFTDNYVYQVLKSDRPDIGTTMPEMYAEMERGIKADPIKSKLFEYIYIPVGQWSYFIGRNF